MVKGMLAVVTALCAGPAMGQILFDQSQLVTHAAQGFNGSDASAIMATAAPGANLYGSSCTGTFHLTDDFIVPAGQSWTINKIAVYCYQTNAANPVPPVSTFTALRLRIFNGDPAQTTSTVIFGDLTTNRLTTALWSNIYRTTDNDIGIASNRAIFRLEADLNPPVVLGAGTYWLNWQATGTVASGPWTPPGTRGPLDPTPGPIPGNGQQWNGTAWVASVNGTSGIQNTFPFVIQGTSGTPCYPDCNQSGTLTIADFGCFQAAFAANNMYADCNNSGTLTIADFGCFQAAFAAGCP